MRAKGQTDWQKSKQNHSNSALVLSVFQDLFWFAPGGCHKEDSSEQQGVVTEEQASVDSLATAAIISEDPHAVLVEFSSVVADTQEYIIKVRATGD